MSKDKHKELKAKIYHDIYCCLNKENCSECFLHHKGVPHPVCKVILSKSIVDVTEENEFLKNLFDDIRVCVYLKNKNASMCDRCYFNELSKSFISKDLECIDFLIDKFVAYCNHQGIDIYKGEVKK